MFTASCRDCIGLVNPLLALLSLVLITAPVGIPATAVGPIHIELASASSMPTNVTPEVAAAVDSRGRIHAAWIQQDRQTSESGNYTLWYSTYDPDARRTRGPALLYEGSSIYSAGITVDEQNIAHVAWVSTYVGNDEISNRTGHVQDESSLNRVYLVSMNSNDDVLGPPRLLLESRTESLWASIISGRKSEPVLAWTEGLRHNSTHAESTAYYARLGSLKDGDRISRTLVMNSTGLYRMLKGSMSFDETSLYLAWVDEFVDGTSRVMYSRVELSRNASTTVSLEELKGTVGRLSLSPTPDGDVIIGWAYQESTLSPPVARLAKLAREGGGSITAADIRLPRYLDELESMAVDSQGNLHTVWVECVEDTQMAARLPRACQLGLYYVRFSSDGQSSEQKAEALDMPVLGVFVLDNGSLYVVLPEGLLQVATPFPKKDLMTLLFAVSAVATVIGSLNTEVGTYHVARWKARIWPWKKRYTMDPSARLDGKLLRKIRGCPGVTFSDLRSIAPYGRIELASRVWMLERSGLVGSSREGTKKRFYYVAKADHGGSRADQVRQTVLCLVDSEPGMTEAQIARRLHLSQQLANYHLRLLSKAKLLRTVRSESKVSYFVNEWYRKQATR